MGMIDRFIGMGATVTAVGAAASTVAEVLTPNATRQMELRETAHTQALAQHQAEFDGAGRGWFDGVMNGMNRLPRPLLTLGTIGLFIHAMVDPVSFAARMEGLALVPEPLWWLMGAIVSFYFGAREAHYFRRRVWPDAKVRTRVIEAAAAQNDGWRAPAAPVAASPEEDGWYAPAPPPEAATAVVAEVEQRGEQAAADPAEPRPLPAAFRDNAALRDWAASGPA